MLLIHNHGIFPIGRFASLKDIESLVTRTLSEKIPPAAAIDNDGGFSCIPPESAVCRQGQILVVQNLNIQFGRRLGAPVFESNLRNQCVLRRLTGTYCHGPAVFHHGLIHVPGHSNAVRFSPNRDAVRSRSLTGGI